MKSKKKIGIRGIGFVIVASTRFAAKDYTGESTIAKTNGQDLQDLHDEKNEMNFIPLYF